MQFLIPSVCDGGVATVGKHDRRAVGGVQRGECSPGAISGACGNNARTSSERIIFQIRSLSVAQMGERFDRDCRF